MPVRVDDVILGAASNAHDRRHHMGILGKLFHRDDSATALADEVVCPHKALTARWDRADDIGKEDLATSFHCEGCGETFSGAEGRRLLHERTAGL
jgi:hypothetical protein